MKPRQPVYLACPYNHPDPAVREERFQAANRMAAKLINDGYLVFSPVSHCHPIAEVAELPKGWDFWGEFDTVIMSVCKRLFVLKMDGWHISEGVNNEIRQAEEWGTPIEYVNPI